MVTDGVKGLEVGHVSLREHTVLGWRESWGQADRSLTDSDSSRPDAVCQ